MDLDNEISKISVFASTLLVKKEDYFSHNLQLASLLILLFLTYILLSFAVIFVPWWLAIILIFVNGYVAYYYFVTAVHEGAHFMIFYSKNKKIQNFVKRLTPAFSMLMGFPAFIVYWRDHVFHHNYLSTEKDPQNSRDLNFRRIPAFYLFRERPPVPKKEILENTNWFAFGIALLIKLLHIYLLFLVGGVLGIFIGFVFPVIIAATLNGLRISFEHFRLYPNPKPLRSRAYTFFGAGIIAPGGLKYHFEHHMFPNIPSYRLKHVYNFIERNCSDTLVGLIHYKRFRWKDFW